MYTQLILNLVNWIWCFESYNSIFNFKKGSHLIWKCIHRKMSNIPYSACMSVLLISAHTNSWNITKNNGFITHTLHESTKLVPLRCKYLHYVAGRGVFILFIWNIPIHHHNDMTGFHFVFTYLCVLFHYVVC